MSLARNLSELKKSLKNLNNIVILVYCDAIYSYKLITKQTLTNRQYLFNLGRHLQGPIP